MVARLPGCRLAPAAIACVWACLCASPLAARADAPLVCMDPLASRPSQSGGFRLNFEDCSLANGPRGRTLDCTDPSLPTVMVASVVTPASYDSIIADLGYVDVFVGYDYGSMPPFWQFHTGGCAGAGRFSVSSDFTSYGLCSDLWHGLAATGYQYGGSAGPLPDGNRARIKWTSWIPPGIPVPIAAGAETYIARISLRQDHLSQCDGCSSWVCLVYVLQEFWLSDRTIVAVDGYDALTLNCGSGCPTPTRASSWGRVKSLYR